MWYLENDGTELLPHEDQWVWSSPEKNLGNGDRVRF